VCPALLVLALATACPSRPQGPRATLEAYLAALEAGNAGAAFGLMAPEYRERVGREAFAERFSAHRQEARARLTAARTAGFPEPELLARLDVGTGLPVRLVHVDGRWLLADGVLAAYPQDTPRRTLHSFVSALERRRWDVLLRFVPAALRADLDAAALHRHVESEAAEVEAMLQRLRRHLDSPIEQEGDRALLRYEGFEFEMRREDGAWRVVDPD